MAREPEKKEPITESEAPVVTASTAKSGRMLTFGIFGGLMILEGVGIFLCMKFLGSDPDPTVGMDQGLTPTTRPWEESQEISVAKVRVPNTSGSRTMLYNVRVAVRVHFNNVERVQKFFERRASTVEDTISRVIRSADERHLNEPGMESLKRQIRYELSSLLGDDTLIEQVLIPACMPMPTGY